MKEWVSRNYKTLIISAFLIPIITVAIVSISHVTTWYGISNPLTWAIYLSIGIEIAALSALAAISANMGSKVYFPFGVVTLIQFIGNIYFAYQFIDVDGKQFKDWVELTSSTLEFIGIDPTDVVGHKRFLSLFAGGMLPIISLSFLHMLVKFTQENGKNTSVVEEKKDVVDSKELVSEISRVRLSDEELSKLENILLKKQVETPPQKEVDETNVVEKKSINEEQEFTNYINKEQVSLPISKIVSNDLKEETNIEDKNKYLFDEYLNLIAEPTGQTSSQTEIIVPESFVVTEELLENQPKEDSPEPIINSELKSEEVSNSDIEEKKKN